MTRQLVLTDRDRALIHAAYSLGYAPASTLLALVSPHTRLDTLRDRLHRLTGARYLSRQQIVRPRGQAWLYGVGPAGLFDGERPWRPSLNQLAHTLAVGEAVVDLQRTGFAAPLQITGWKGEAELRAWVAPGSPFPDAEITWRHAHVDGRWHVEVDRATESRAVWRRKLVRYLTFGSEGPVLVLTTSGARARNLALVAAELGVWVLATTSDVVKVQLDPWVLDSRARQRRPLSATAGEDTPSPG